MQVVPLSKLPNQIFNITIDGVAWRIAVYEKKGYDDDGNSMPRLYCDFMLNGAALVAGLLVSIGVPLLRSKYLTPGSTQDFFFIDTKGRLPPVAAGLSDRWVMLATDANDF